MSATYPTLADVRKALGVNGNSAACPWHEDKHNSLSLGESAEGKPLFKCHAGCSQTEVIEGLRSKGISWPLSEKKGLTVAQFAAEKGLPEQLMWESGFADDTSNGQDVIRIDYEGANGERLCTRYRAAGKRFWFKKGDKQQLYGLWRLKAAETVILVEGETDSIAMWDAGFNAVGVPGAEAWHERFAEHVEHCPTIYVHVEPDEGGKKFRAKLEKSRLAPKMLFFTVSGAKDPCELRAKDVAGFADSMRQALQTAAPIQQPEPPATLDPFSWLEEHEMTDTEVQQIAEATFIEGFFIVEGHLIAIVAKPNGGKTTIVFGLACAWPKLGYQVVYVHADTNPADAKRMHEIARQHNVRYLTPDLKVGKRMLDVVEELEKLASSDADLSGWVFIFDTLKKMTNVIQKSALRDLLMFLRKLSARGMTIIVLAHTNKYKNAEGEYQYEGTADLEADVDELIYFEPRENPDGSLTVSTRCAKRRANIVPMTWDIGKDRSVTRRDEYVDVAGEAQKAKQREEDSAVIEAVTECLSAGSKKQVEIITHCQPLKITEKRVRRVLIAYSGELWKAEKLFEKNAWRYHLLGAQDRRA